MLNSTVQRLTAFTMLLAASVLSLGPIYVMVVGSFKTQSEFLTSPIGLPGDVGLAAYEAALRGGFWNAMINSIVLTVGSVVVSTVVGAFAAWGLARARLRSKESLVTGIASLMVVPPVVLVVPLFLLGVSLGAISSRWYVIFLYTGLVLPFSIYMLFSYFRSIPRELLEAAEVDGASGFSTFTRIVVPLSAAPIATLAALNAFWAWNELLIVLVLIQDNALHTLMVSITQFQSRYSLDIPVVLAGLTIASAPVVLVYLFAQRFLVFDVQAGGVKGE
ncbi:MAG: carbohydrate ABC transporter permease [Dehalococcoidia bacterium]